MVELGERVAEKEMMQGGVLGLEGSGDEVGGRVVGLEGGWGDW